MARVFRVLGILGLAAASSTAGCTSTDANDQLVASEDASSTSLTDGSDDVEPSETDSKERPPTDEHPPTTAPSSGSELQEWGLHLPTLPERFVAWGDAVARVGVAGGEMAYQEYRDLEAGQSLIMSVTTGRPCCVDARRL